MSPPLFLRALLLVVGAWSCTAAFAQAPDAETAAPRPARATGVAAGVFVPAGAAPADHRTATLPNPDNLLATPGKDYRVGPNDLLDIEILDLDNFKRTVRVNAAGAITLPLIGPTQVAGMSAQQAESHIAVRYSEKYLQNPQVSVFIKEYTTERITVDGAVVKPGIYPLTGQITLLRALALAGGFGQIAKSSEVMLFRVNAQGERQVAMFDVDLIRSGKSDDPAIRGDDLIVVQRDATRRMLKDSVFRDVLDTFNPFKIVR